MDKFYRSAKEQVVNYKLDLCCWLAPLRTGILFIGFVNIFISVILLLGVSTGSDSFVPTIKRVQMLIFEDTSTICVLLPATELAFNVLLLCGMFRNDVVLLRFYMYYGMVAICTWILVFLIIVGIGLLDLVVIIISILYQGYVVILVRSAIVEIRSGNSLHKNGVVNKEPHQIYTKTVPDVESQHVPQQHAVTLPETEQNLKKDQIKLETVNEEPKLESAEEIFKSGTFKKVELSKKEESMFKKSIDTSKKETDTLEKESDEQTVKDILKCETFRKDSPICKKERNIFKKRIDMSKKETDTSKEISTSNAQSGTSKIETDTSKIDNDTSNKEINTSIKKSETCKKEGDTSDIESGPANKESETPKKDNQVPKRRKWLF